MKKKLDEEDFIVVDGKAVNINDVIGRAPCPKLGLRHALIVFAAFVSALVAYGLFEHFGLINHGAIYL